MTTEIPEFLIEHDNPTFKTTFKDSLDSAIVDITGGTINFRFRTNRGPVQEKLATITNALLGQAEFTILEEDLRKGQLDYEWRFTDSSPTPKRFTSQLFSLIVRRKQ